MDVHVSFTKQLNYHASTFLLFVRVAINHFLKKGWHITDGGWIITKVPMKYLANVGAESCIENNDASVIVSTNKIHQPQPKTQHQKYNAAQLLALRVATVISEAGSKEFDNKMSILKKVLQCWENGKSICVIGKEAAANDEFIEELECENNTDGPSEEIASHENKSDISLDNESGAAGDDEDSLNNLTLETREIPESLFSVQEIVVDETGNIDEETIDDDDYNEAVRLVIQEEENQGNYKATSKNAEEGST